MAGIYKITSPSEKVYIGKTIKSFEQRFSYYKRMHCKRQQKLYNSLLKYGFDSHKFEILENFENPVKIHYIDAYEEALYLEHVEAGYQMLNIRIPGYNPKHSIETKKKISDSLKGKTVSRETILKRENSKKENNTTGKGIPKSEETRRKISEALKGRKTPKEVIEKREKTMKELKIREKRKGIKFKNND